MRSSSARGCSSALPGLVGKRAETVAVILRRAAGGAGASGPCRIAGRRRVPGGGDRRAGRRGGQGRRGARAAVVLAGGSQVTRTDCVVGDRRGSGDRPRRLRRRDLAARRAGRARADHAARHGRRGGRRQDRDRHPGGQEPGRRVPPAGRGARRPGDPGDACRAPTTWPASPRSSRPASSPTARSCGWSPRTRRSAAAAARRAHPRAHRAGDRGQGPRGLRRPARVRAAGDAQLRAHARPRHREA